MSLTTATILVAVATLLLALVTVATLVITIRRDNAKRQEDRQRDDQLRAEQRARDDRLRQDAAQEAERRERAERTGREDYEARQVLDKYDDMRGILTVSTPHPYPIKQVRGAWVYEQGSENLSTIEFDRGHDDPRVDDTCAHYDFRVRSDHEAETIIRFTDWHGNLYFRYRGYTNRGKQNAEFLEAAREISLWIRTGPNPD